MGPVLLFCLWLFIIGLLIVFLAWVIISNSHYTSKLLKPNDIYTVEDRTYTFPNLECIGPTYLLRDYYITNLRHLLALTAHLLQGLNVEWWLTGGSLMGAVKHDAIPMPFDDDVDIGVDDDLHRKFLFSTEFVQAANKASLNVLYLKHASSNRAERTGACVRLQLPYAHCTLDIFFWKKMENNTKVVKLDGWSGVHGMSVVRNVKERFVFEDVYPLQKDVIVDAMTVNLVRNPINVLVQQYGKTVMKLIIARSMYVSHLFPFLFLRQIWVTNIAPG